MSNIDKFGISDKEAVSRLKEMGKLYCPEGHTLAQTSEELKKICYEQGPYVSIMIDGIPHHGPKELLEKFLKNELNLGGRKKSPITSEPSLLK